MSKRRRKPGRLFWLWTFAVGVYSPSKGQRRIAATMAAKNTRIAELEYEITQLGIDKTLQMDKEAELVARINDLEARLEMSDGVSAMDEVKTTARKLDATIPLRAPSWATTDPSDISRVLGVSQEKISF